VSSTTFNLGDPLSSADSHGKIEKILARAKSLAETNIPEALRLVQTGISLASKDSEFEPLDLQVAECFHVEGCIYLNQSQYRFALVSFSKAKEIYEVLNEPRATAVELCSIGLAQGYLGLYPDALRNMFEALGAFEAIDDRVMIAKTLNGIGYNYVWLHEYTKSIPLLSKSVAIARETGDQEILAGSLDSLARACLGT
jgi:tetratricopeptide (TPR) repeat protein